MCRLSGNLGASTSWNPQGLSRPVMGLHSLIFAISYFHDFIYIPSCCLAIRCCPYRNIQRSWQIVLPSGTELLTKITWQWKQFSAIFTRHSEQTVALYHYYYTRPLKGLTQWPVVLNCNATAWFIYYCRINTFCRAKMNRCTKHKRERKHDIKKKNKPMAANLCTEMFRTSGIMLYRTGMLRKCCTT